jgi:O-antigen/teichoic acid export membrane protein
VARDAAAERAVSFTRHTLLTLATSVTMMLLGMVTSVVVARSLGPYGKGLLYIVTLVAQTVASFGGLGLGSAAIYYLGRGENRRAVVSTLTGAGLGLGAIYVLVCLAATDLLRRYVFKDVGPGILLVSYVLVPAVLLKLFYEMLLVAEHRFEEYNGALLLYYGVRASGMALLLVVFHAGAFGAIALEASLLVSVATWLGWRVSRHGRFTPRIDRPVLRRLLSYGLKGHAGTVAQQINLRAGMYVLAAVSGSGAVGVYSVSVLLAEVIWYIPNSVGTVFFPRISSASREEANRMTPLVCRNTFFVTLAGAVGMAVLGGAFIRLLYGAAFASARDGLLLLLPGVALLSLGKILMRYSMGIGKVLYATYASVAGLLIGVPMLFVLVPRFGFRGAAVASSLAYTADACVNALFYLRASGGRVRDLVWPQAGDLRQCRTALVTAWRDRGGTPS